MCVCRRFEFAMGKTPRPDISASSERLQVCAEYARVRLAFGGVLEAALSGVTSTAYRVCVIPCCTTIFIK